MSDPSPTDNKLPTPSASPTPMPSVALPPLTPALDIQASPSVTSHNVVRGVALGLIGGGAAALSLVNPAIAIIAGSLAPVISEYLSEVVKHRAHALHNRLHRHGVDLEKLQLPEDSLGRLKMDLLKEAISAAMGSDYDAKIDLIARVLKSGIESNVAEEVILANRIARTVNRIDEIEFRVLWGMRNSQSQPNGFSLTELKNLGNLKSADMLSSAMAVLTSEGLVRLSGNADERWHLTDFGFRLLGELKHVYG